ncbi:MAG: hypothetical protein M3Z11_08910 [Candidatus Dormibacteraeota bacterium]|nr:hypothetical protein [Candidatus Dormibacteraeota bacterium]
MANVLTRVPSTPPPIDRIQLWLLPIADAVMAAMWSRPGGLSLRTTWVTPATVWLCLGVALFAVVLAIALVSHGLASGQPISLILGIVALVVAFAIGTVAAYGLRQRALARG